MAGNATWSEKWTHGGGPHCNYETPPPADGGGDGDDGDYDYAPAA